MNTDKKLLGFVQNRKDWIKIWEFYFSLWFLDRAVDVHIKRNKQLGYENKNTLHVFDRGKEDAFFLEKEIQELKKSRTRKLLSQAYMESHYKNAKLAIKEMRGFSGNHSFGANNDNESLAHLFLEYSDLLEKLLFYYRASRPEIFEIADELIKNPKTAQKKKKYLKSLVIRYGKLRLEIKNAWLYGEEKAKVLKSKLSRALEISSEELEYLTTEEIISLLNKRRPVGSIEKIVKDRKFCVFGLLKGKKILITGEDAKKIAKRLAPSIEKSEIISGNSAFPGLVKGRVRIIPQTNHEEMMKSASRFKKGEILVAGMTQPDIIMAYKKAKAIITDEGGITSHAAIISRELKIPCVIGTKTATRVLKDGDLVEVNANKGEIKIL